MKQVTVSTGDGWQTILTRRQRQDLSRRNRGEFEHAQTAKLC